MSATQAPRRHGVRAGGFCRWYGKAPMQRRMTGFHQDAESHWVAELDCGHTQHVRHQPPFTLRPWVLTDEGRAARVGQTLDCALCDASDT